MLLVFIRSFIIYVLVFIVIRAMGKRELSQLQPFELLIIVTIADLAASPLSSNTIPLINGVASIVCLLIVYIVFTILIQSSNVIQKIMCDRATVIISNGKIVEKELRKQQYTVDELMSQVRNQGEYKISDIQYAILETSGSLNIINKNNNYKQLPLVVISDGKINMDSLKYLKLNKEYINNILTYKKLILEDILYAILDENNQFIYQLKEEKYKEWEIEFF